MPNRGPTATDAIPAQTVFAGDTASLDLSAHFSDPDGDSLAYSAESSDATAVSLSVAGRTLSIRATAQGEATVTVTATDPGGLSADQAFAVTVPNRAPAAVGTMPPHSVGIGRSASLDVSSFFSDPDGDALSYSATASNPAVATVTALGSRVTTVGVARGTTRVIVTARDPKGLTAQHRFPVTVTLVSIASVEPNVLVEGASATITGFGYSFTAAQNQVSVGGLAARVTSATATSLSIIVPRSDCLPPRRAELMVTVGGHSDARTVGVTPHGRKDLALPQYWYRYTTAGDGCVHLPGSSAEGEYVIGVTSVSEDPSSLTAMILNGMPGDATVVAGQAGTPGHAVGFAATASSGAFGTGRTKVRAAPAADFGLGDLFTGPDSFAIRRARFGGERMARNEALLRELGTSSLPQMASRQYRNLEVGDRITLYEHTKDWTCSGTDRVTAVVRLVGRHSVWLEDVANPSGTFADSELAALDAFYSENVKTILDDYYGSLSDVDGNGRILILMTQEVNRAGYGGEVWPGDFFPTHSCPASNHAEIFYAFVPDPDGVVGPAFTREQVLKRYPPLLTHEIAHLVQLAATRVFGRAGQKKSWELEGGAVLAEQLVGYRLFGHGSRQDLGYAQFAVGRDWYGGWLWGLSLFFGWDPQGGRVRYAPEQCTWIGRPREGNTGPCREGSYAVYGVPSMVLRYALDRWGGGYPGGERALMKRLTQSPAEGFASLEDVSSWRIERILADFYSSLWLELQGVSVVGMASWNLHDVFGRYDRDLMLQPYVSSSTQPQVSGRIRAGSSLYLHWTPSGPLSPTSIKVTSADGGPLPDHISVWALRVR